MDLLKVENLSKSFGALWAVNSVSFSVAEGEIVGLIGPNGSGKSTVFHSIRGCSGQQGQDQLSGQGHHAFQTLPGITIRDRADLSDRPGPFLK
jgi:ABC-type branched-subunit amino acid transport system ATPase component